MDLPSYFTRPQINVIFSVRGTFFKMLSCVFQGMTPSYVYTLTLMGQDYAQS